MYEEFFGLSKSLLPDGLAQDEDVFLTVTLNELVRDLEIALTRKDSVAILSGGSGTGKSTIAGHALRGMSTRLAFSCISHAPLTPHELLEQLLTDFGLEPYKSSRVERLQAWHQFLAEMQTTDTRVCILVENAEALSIEVAAALHNLTVPDASSRPGANVLLTATRPPESLLQAPELHAFNQRVRLRRRLDVLSADEARAYLVFKVRNAGATFNDVFAPEFADAIHGLSGGVIRMIDNLLESTLITAAARHQKPMTRDLVIAVAVDHFGMRGAATPADVDEMLERQVDDLPEPEANPPVTADMPQADAFLANMLEMSSVDDPRKQTGPAASHETPDEIDADAIPTLTDSVPPAEDAGESDIATELEAAANAKRLEDISNSMAETIFGDDALDELAAVITRRGSAQN